MTLRQKMLHHSIPVTLFEVVPPAAEHPEKVKESLSDLKRVKPFVDGVNLPEIHDEFRGTARTSRFVPRLEPRVYGCRIQRELGMEVVLNHVVVHDQELDKWLQETCYDWGLQNLVLVGGEASGIRYPGPNVFEAAVLARRKHLPVTLGGITIPSRRHEAARVRVKAKAGMDFFTSQILFDSNDVVWLVQQLNGLRSRLFLSFAPVTHPHDLQFLRWLGADIPQDLDSFLLGPNGSSPPTPAQCLERSLDLAQRILTDVFDNLPPDPPPLGLNIEHINQRNFSVATRMVDRLGNLYTNLVTAHARREML
jgi:5,10-methylenetetrahydrofolate reductase